MAGTSTWRTNDVVVYDAMRESATFLTYLLLRTATADPATSAGLFDEVAELRRNVLYVDGFDRAAVVALAERIDSRMRELSRSAS